MNIFNHSKIITFNLIVASIIPFLIWGPFFPDLIVSISSLFFLYQVLKNKNYNYFLKTFNYIFYFLYLLYFNKHLCI